MIQIFKDVRLDWLANRRWFITVSIVLMLAGWDRQSSPVENTRMVRKPSTWGWISKAHRRDDQVSAASAGRGHHAALEAKVCAMRSSPVTDKPDETFVCPTSTCALPSQRRACRTLQRQLDQSLVRLVRNRLDDRIAHTFRLQCGCGWPRPADAAET